MMMQKLDYYEFKGEPREWELMDCTFGEVNLIVGKNASGKTRTLRIISGLAKLFSGDRKPFNEGNFDVEFVSGAEFLKYTLRVNDGIFTKEKLEINSQTMMERDSEGRGEIYYTKEQKSISFQIPTDKVAAYSKTDSLQHPFLDKLYIWGKHLRSYEFGTSLGQYNLLAIKGEEVPDQILQDQKEVVGIFMKGMRDFPDLFVNSIIKDMEYVGYQIEQIGVETPQGVTFSPAPGTKFPLPSEVLGLYIKEKDLSSKINQIQMSQGMFRTLSVLIQINYLSISGVSSCILIDDIGEGLDYDRSSSLIKLMIDKAKANSFQLIMTTNDRFVMNNVPLDYWIILHREGGKCRNFNYRNSKEIFEEFELTGLSNFDLFSSKYYMKTKNE